MLKLALFGDPVHHSLSPQIHRAFARQFDLQIDYQLIQASPTEFAGKLQIFKDSGAKGGNITVPLKQQAYKLASHSSDAGQDARAVNTFVFKTGKIEADNTDGQGWLNDLYQSPAKIQNRTICILGAGGAAAGLLPIILAADPARLIIANRSKDKAEQLLAEQAGAYPAIKNSLVVSLPELSQAENLEIDLLINATSIGHQGKCPDFSKNILKSDALIYDLNYGPAAAPLENWCKQNHFAYRDGLGMLVEQAALAFTLWTGKNPDTQVVLSQIRNQIT